MTAFVICSSGVLLRFEKGALLIDAPNEPCLSFEALSDEELSKIIKAQYPYDLPLCIAFTHLHPDHYSATKLHSILDARPATEVILPSTQAKDVPIFGGTCLLQTYPTPHTRAPGFDDVVHNTFYITAEKSVYLSSDAKADAALHRQILSGRKANLAFWNHQYLSYPETRSLLAEAAQQNFIYHIPIDPEDKSGMRRKALRSFERYASELPNSKLILSYPSQL